MPSATHRYSSQTNVGVKPRGSTAGAPALPQPVGHGRIVECIQAYRSDGMGMWRTIGHQWAVEQLASAVGSGRISRANLFTGPERVGKLHLALEFAAALNCISDIPPCGACAHCTRIHAGVHPDVTIIRPDGGHVKIGQIRQMEYELALRPYEARWRVAIITEMQTATEEAENALLKTLEEPPAQAVLILTAVDAGLLEPTIVSRCRMLALQPVPADIIAEALKDRGIEPALADETARLSGGLPGWALEAAGGQSGGAKLPEILVHFVPGSGSPPRPTQVDCPMPFVVS